MDKKELNEILEKHKKWLNGKRVGEQANLRWANLQWADLQGVDLRWADLRWADLRWANLQGAALRWANLQWAALQWADLQGADIDFSCWPLWCGSKNIKMDNRLVFQLVAHICALDCDTPEYKQIKEFLLPYAIQSHRASDLGLFELSSELPANIL